MSEKLFVAYYRVSTDKQKRSGLGLEAQREAVLSFIRTQGGKLIAEHQEAESGKRADRPELARALAATRSYRATLIIAKLDRLSRDSLLLKTVLRSGVPTQFCDLPTVPAGPVGAFMTGMLAEFAELEAGLISQRTKDALARAKARGTKLGGKRDNSHRIGKLGAKASATVRKEKAAQWTAAVRPELDEVRRAGAQSLREMAAALNARGVRTVRGGAWDATQVRRVLLVGRPGA